MLLAGCGPSVRLEVTGADVPAFGLASADSPACPRTLAVYRVAGGQIAWRIGQRDPRSCPTRIDYGALPRGYRELAPARMLIGGATYRVAVTGPGFNEQAVFTARVPAKAALRPPSAAPADPRSR